MPDEHEGELPTLILKNIKDIAVGSSYETDESGTLYYVMLQADDTGIQLAFDTRDEAIVVITSLLQAIARDQGTPKDWAGPDFTRSP